MGDVCLGRIRTPHAAHDAGEDTDPALQGQGQGRAAFDEERDVTRQTIPMVVSLMAPVGGGPRYVAVYCAAGSGMFGYHRGKNSRRGAARGRYERSSSDPGVHARGAGGWSRWRMKMESRGEQATEPPGERFWRRSSVFSSRRGFPACSLTAEGTRARNTFKTRC